MGEKETEYLEIRILDIKESRTYTFAVIPAPVSAGINSGRNPLLRFSFIIGNEVNSKIKL